MDLAGKHVLVTGAGKRLGRAISEKLIPYGIKLSAHYRSSKAEAESLITIGRDRGAEVFPVAADLGDVPSLERMVASAVARFGPVDVLVNSASDFFPTPALDVTEAQWDHFLDVNLKGQFFLAQACARSGMRTRGGLIVNLGDVNGERALKNFTPYVCSKAGLLMMTRNLAKEWAPEVRVNSVSPGAVLLPESYTEEQKKRSIERSLLKRLGTPDDIAEAVLFLAQNDYVTGFDLKVDGGRILS